jgi:hypothetical protein
VNSLRSADVGQTTVAKYMAKRRRPPSQGWRTFVHNHADAIASIDMFVVPTISFGLLYGLLILRQSRRELLWRGVTAHPNAEWLTRQLTEACGWDELPRYLIRDRDRAYGAAIIRRIWAMGITPIAAEGRAGSAVMCAVQGACVRRRSWAGCTINMFEFEFPTGTAAMGPMGARHAL